LGKDPAEVIKEAIDRNLTLPKDPSHKYTSPANLAALAGQEGREGGTFQAVQDQLVRGH
jgi:hypothetical protein